MKFIICFLLYSIFYGFLVQAGERQFKNRLDRNEFGTFLNSSVFTGYREIGLNDQTPLIVVHANKHFISDFSDEKVLLDQISKASTNLVNQHQGEVFYLMSNRHMHYLSDKEKKELDLQKSLMRVLFGMLRVNQLNIFLVIREKTTLFP